MDIGRLWRGPRNSGRIGHVHTLSACRCIDIEDYGSARNFGHVAYAVDDIYGLCERLMAHGVTINRPPRDGRMAFVRSPDQISIELLQAGEPLPPTEPWLSMPNTGVW